MTTPTYDKSHYSWVAPSSLASKSIIENAENSTSNSPAPEPRDRTYHPPNIPSSATDSTQDPERPSRPRRSSSNYLTDAQEYKKLLERQEQEERDEEAGQRHQPQQQRQQTQQGKRGGGAGGEEEEQTEGEKGVSKQLSEKPKFGRQKTWDYEDMKRQMHGKLMMTDGEEK